MTLTINPSVLKRKMCASPNAMSPITPKQKVNFKQIKKEQKKYKASDEEDVPLGILYYTKLRRVEENKLVDLKDKSLEEIQMDIWKQCWEEKVLKHKKERRREQCIIGGDLY